MINVYDYNIKYTFFHTLGQHKISHIVSFFSTHLLSLTLFQKKRLYFLQNYIILCTFLMELGHLCFQSILTEMTNFTIFILTHPDKNTYDEH